MTNIPNAEHQRGFTLIEALVALLVAALGVLGILGMQMRTLADTQTAVRRAQAIRLIEDLSERMRTVPSAYHDFRSAGLDSNSPLADVIADWKVNANTLPSGQVSVFPVQSGYFSQIGVLVAWRQNERHDADEDYLQFVDSTKVMNTDGNLVSAIDNADNKCPDGFTCHLQYIPVPTRCTTSADFSDQFFCE